MRHFSLAHLIILFSYSVFLSAHDTPSVTAMPQSSSSFEQIIFQEQEISPLCYALPVANSADTIEFAEDHEHNRAGKNHWTILVYMAADNDLKTFAARNIRQMAAIGSRNPHLNILVHLDIRLNNNYKVTRRYLIEQGKITHLNAHDATTQRMDSGDPKTLISFCEWGIKNFAAEHYMLIFWDHGTGYLDPEKGRILDPSLFFILNPETHKWELDRSVEYMELVEQRCDLRGVCWDDTTGNYLNNQKLVSALDHICKNFLGGKKIDIIGFDACLMAMVEVGSLIKPYAHIMVASQEVELGTGWDYSRFLEPLSQRALTKEELAATIVEGYNQTYKAVTEDYTLSAVNLDQLEKVELRIGNVARILKKCMSQQIYNSVTNSIKASRNKVLCTHFEEPSYIDLHHWATNMLANMQHFVLKENSENASLLSSLRTELVALKGAIDAVVFASCVGPKLNKARGLSLYFPEQFIFKSYPHSPFAQQNEWYSFLQTFLRG